MATWIIVALLGLLVLMQVSILLKLRFFVEALDEITLRLLHVTAPESEQRLPMRHEVDRLHSDLLEIKNKLQ